MFILAELYTPHDEQICFEWFVARFDHFILLTLEDLYIFLPFIRIAKNFKSKRLRLQLGGDFISLPHYCEISNK